VNIRLSAVHEDPRITPLPFKEVLGVVGGVSGAGAHYLQPHLREEGSNFRAGRETQEPPAKRERRSENVKKC